MPIAFLKANAQTLALSAVAAGETFHLGSACMPSYFTARNWVLDGTPDEQRQRIADYRSGYRPAAIVGVGLSVALSVLAESPLPTIFAVGAAIVMLQMYEHALPPEVRLSLADWPELLLTGEVSGAGCSGCGKLTSGQVPALAPASNIGL